MTEVAQILKVSEKAIVFHEYRIMASFNLKNNSGLVLFALKHHLISSHDSEPMQDCQFWQLDQARTSTRLEPALLVSVCDTRKGPDRCMSER